MPRGFDKTDYFNELRTTLIGNGFSNSLQIEEYSLSGKLMAWWNNSPTGAVVFTHHYGNMPMDAGGHARLNEPNSIIIYPGLDGRYGQGRVDMWAYVKKVLKALLMLVAALVISVAGFRLLFSSANTTEYKIFEVYSDGYFLHKVLGVTPRTYEDGFEIKTIERYDETEVLYVIDKNGSAHPNFIVLKEGSKIEILKGYPFMFNNTSEGGLDFKRHVSESINLEVFNSYVVKHNMSRQEAIKKYCFFLSREELQGSFLLIENREDIDSLIISFLEL